MNEEEKVTPDNKPIEEDIQVSEEDISNDEQLQLIIDNQEKLIDYLNPEGKDKELLLQEIEDNQKLLAEQEKVLKAEKEKTDKFQSDLLESNKQLNDNLSEYIKLSNENEDGSVSQMELVLTKMDNILEGQSYLITGSNTVITYGILYIPLAVICILLWRFFSTFLRQVR